MSRRYQWFEAYECGCVSDYEDYKKDLCGYCPTHGNDRRQTFRVHVDDIAKAKEGRP